MSCDLYEAARSACVGSTRWVCTARAAPLCLPLSALAANAESNPDRLSALAG